MIKKTLLFSLATLLLSLPQPLLTFQPSETLKIYHANTLPTTQLSWEQTLLQLQSNDNARLHYLSRLGSGRPVVPVAAGMTITHNPSYIVKARIGTPPQTLLMAVDTGNDAAWIPCTGCIGCSAAGFDSAKSSTFRTVPCDATQCSQVPSPSCGGATCSFNWSYGGSSFSANLVQDTVGLISNPITGYTFGCIQTANGTSLPPQGLLGLGRGPLSLTSQTSELYQSTFSYCLPNLKSANFTGSLKLGPQNQPQKINCTPLLRNARRSSLYYANLTAIKVGDRVLCIPPTAFAFDATTGGGTFFDSGTMFTSLVKPAYTAVRDELRRRMGNATVSSLGGFDTYGTTSCLGMAAAPDNVDAVVNVIGSFQQQNHRIVIDELNSRVCVSREACSKRVPRLASFTNAHN
ncbi:Aspartyl protease AED3 [Sesamum alatum]|uniref:Aspartyl protease AED3 n=1 Tax=Sesamum alatum TaxID=300844 RepID=A0AAE1XME5_9LAMI|nr:Aspartyl protease AED3 [Sesamum alatum]